jgi:hypothetical protein
MAATFVVETGSGSATANSYLTVAEADQYTENYFRGKTAWTSLSDALKQRYLREATQSVDAIYGPRWRGYRWSSTQALDWPRQAVVTSEGWDVNADEIPDAVKRATMEFAWRHLQGADLPDADGTSALIPDTDEGQNLKVEDVSVGSLRERKEYFGTKSSSKRFRKVDLILRRYLVPLGQIVRG